MTAQPICSESELRYRSTHNLDDKHLTDPWSTSCGQADELDTSMRLDNTSPEAEFQRLQEVEPISRVDNLHSPLNPPNKR